MDTDSTVVRIWLKVSSFYALLAKTVYKYMLYYSCFLLYGYTMIYKCIIKLFLIWGANTDIITYRKVERCAVNCTVGIITSRST